MLDAIFRVSDYLQYLMTANSRHGIHSPFVYSFYEKVIQSKEKSPYFDLIETIRKKMIQSKVKIDFVDFGVGNKSGERRISEIASTTAKNAKYGRLLYRLLHVFQPVYSLELGTGSGITAMYQGAALNSERPLHSIEGSEKLAEIAAYNARECGIYENIIFHTGTFENVLPELLQQMPRVDYAYIDGNHGFEPTIRYFEMIMEKVHEQSILIFDDINWSEGMKRAWAVIKNDPRVQVSIDLFALGIVFLRKGQEKEHFTLRY
ncbi:MAG: class I SAM-dependent methyltransferase [Bacteroidetes bacterium]|nr:class I SAM-dependent methyltransferase [Bacteroidota bacterium]